jgi:hypothetical protein
MPCSCGGMRRSGLAPNQSNIAIRQKQSTPSVPPPAPVQILRPTQPQSQPTTTFQSNRPNFSGNLPRRR